MGPIGVPEMLAIFVIALLLFGPKKLPELGRTLGKAITEFRRASNELKSTFESHLTELEREVQLEKQSEYTRPPNTPTYSYSHNEYSHYTPDYTGLPEAPPQAVEHSSTVPSFSSEIHPDTSHNAVGSEASLHPKINQPEAASVRTEETHGA